VTKSVEGIIADSRRILQDRVEPFRNSQDDLLSALNNGLYEMKRLRPDAWLTYFGKPLPQYADNATDLAAVIPINEMFVQQLVYWIIGYTELQDDEYTVDGRAALLVRAFGADLTESRSLSK
jgi:hypothetical protein